MRDIHRLLHANSNRATVFLQGNTVIEEVQEVREFRRHDSELPNAKSNNRRNKKEKLCRLISRTYQSIKERKLKNIRRFDLTSS